MIPTEAKTMQEYAVACKYFPNRVRYLHVKRQLDPQLDEFMTKKYKFSKRVKGEILVLVNHRCYVNIKLYDSKTSDFLTWALTICRNECELKDRRILQDLKSLI